MPPCPKGRALCIIEKKVIIKEAYFGPFFSVVRFRFSVYL